MIRKRPLFCWVCTFIAGIVFRENIERTTFFVVLLFLCFFLYYSKYLFWGERSEGTAILTAKSQHRENISRIICALFLLFGYIYSGLFTENRTGELNELFGKTESFEGIICEKQDGKYVIKDVSFKKRIRTRGLVTCDCKLEIGDSVRFRGRIEKPKETRNFGGFNYAQYLRTKDIYFSCKVDEVENLGLGNFKLDNFAISLSENVRKYVEDFAMRTLPEELVGVEEALLVGEDKYISDSLQEEYIESGMIHLLVVSGSHMAFIILAFMFVYGWADKRAYKGKFGLITVILIYTVITGCTPSVVRAAVMAIIIIIGDIIGRKSDTLTTIGLAGLVILIDNPEVIYSLSFQLSFLGAIGIVVGSSEVNKLLMFLPKKVSSAIAVAISALIFVSPITVLNFNVIYFAGVIAGTIAAGLVNVIMAIGFLGVFMSIILPVVGEATNRINILFISILNKIAEIFANVDWMQITLTTPSWIIVTLYYFLILCFLKKINIRKKFLVWGTAGILVILMANYAIPRDFEVDFIDVGHGDSIAITTPHRRCILIDTGGTYFKGEKEYNSGELTVVPRLLDKGYKVIDLLVLTHLDIDHIGGLEKIIERIKVKTVVVSVNSNLKEKFGPIKQLLEDRGIEIIQISKGKEFSIDGVRFSVLHPEKQEGFEENNDSICMKAEYSGVKMLFMGDLTVSGEKKLIEDGVDLKADILKLGHHGSITSTSEEFLKAVSPKVAIASVGTRFKSIPSQEVLRRLSLIDAKVYRTDEDGEIIMKIGKNKNGKAPFSLLTKFVD